MNELSEPALSTRLFALLKTLNLAIVVMILFFAFLGELLRRSRVTDVKQILPIVAIPAILEIGAVIYVRVVKIPKVGEVLRQNAEDRVGLEGTRKWYVVAMALCAGVSLYGFALRIMGSVFWPAAAFYVVGIALALYCSPRKPE